jgi:hypothetical protein
MLNPLIDIENTKNVQSKDPKSSAISDDCSWCIFCDLKCLFMCCLE